MSCHFTHNESLQQKVNDIIQQFHLFPKAVAIQQHSTHSCLDIVQQMRKFDNSMSSSSLLDRPSTLLLKRHVDLEFKHKNEIYIRECHGTPRLW